MATKSVAKSSAKPLMKYRKKASCEFRRLPFIAESNWDVPPTGGYGGGCEFGKWAAIAYLKMLRASDSTMGGFLQGIVLAMLQRSDVADNDHSFKGQIVGFFSTLDQALHVSAKTNARLDEYSEPDLAAAMQRALRFDEKAWADAMGIIEKFNGIGATPFIPFTAYRRTNPKLDPEATR